MSESDEQTTGLAATGKLLLVDDDAGVLRSLKRVLRRGHWLIETAVDGEEALEVARRFEPDVVMADFLMPKMNGVEFLTRVKELFPKAQRIMLTGQADPHAVEEAINRSEVFRFLSKPWNDAQLLLSVKSAFEQHHLLAENERLYQLSCGQNAELKVLNAELEDRVWQRTEALSQANRAWELTFDTISHPLVVVQTDDWVVRRANLAAAKVARKAIEVVAQRPRCHQFLFERPTPCEGCAMGPELGQRPRKPREFEWAERAYELSIYPMEDEPVAVCSYRDVTEERLITQRLVESEKMIAIGNLAGGVAHEINNPLGGILAFAQLMKRDPGRAVADLESLSLIEESALRSKRIVDSLLKFSRRPKLEDRRRFDLARCVEDTAVLFRAQLKTFPRCKLDLQVVRDLPELYGDSAQLAQVLLNLLQNALQATPGGEGTITISTGMKGSSCFFSVKDQGVGVPPELRQRIFEPHFTTKKVGEGTGLGLAIAYRIVEDHGGHFDVQSEPGQGSTFTVLIPSST